MVMITIVKYLMYLPTWSLVKVEYSIFFQIKKGDSFLVSSSGFDEFRGA